MPDSTATRADSNTARRSGRLTLLTTVGVQAVKTFSLDAEGNIKEEGYGRAKTFTASEIDVDERGNWLRRLGPKANSFVVLGSPIDWKPGERKRRLSSDRDGDEATIEECARLWMPIDVDKIAFEPLSSIDDGETFALQTVGVLGLRDVHCVYHLTNSHGIRDRWRLRLWVKLAKPATTADMKEFARARWGDAVDLAVYRPAQPIYTGDPIFEGVDDPVSERVGVIDGSPLKLGRQRPATQGAAGKGAPEDENIVLLREAGLYIDQLRPGQHKIECPWEDDHTEAGHRDDDTFYFEPHFNGHDIPAFKCHHAHCADKHWADVLLELGIKGNGGFDPVEDDEDPRWVFITRLKQFWDGRDGALIDMTSYDLKHGWVSGRRGESPTQKFLASNKTIKVDAAEFLPGMARTVRRGTVETLNIYTDARVRGDESIDVSPWTEHLAWLVPNERDRETLCDWMAWVYQHPGTKVTWAPILYSYAQGNGKTTVMNVLADCLGRRYMSEPTQAEIEDKFTDWAYKKLLVKIEELRSGERYQVAEKLKPIVANPTISIRGMHEKGFSTTNTVSVIASTNHDDALPMETSDRRWMFIQCCEAPTREERRVHMRSFHRWLRKVGHGGIAHWLGARNVASFAPESEAPDTELKRHVTEATKTDFQRAIELCEVFDDKPIIVSSAVSEYLTANEITVPTKKLGLLAKRRGWRGHSSGRFRHRDRFITLWTGTRNVNGIRNIVNMSADARSRAVDLIISKLLAPKFDRVDPIGKATGSTDDDEAGE